MGDFDADISFLGNWGRFQQIVFFLISASNVPNGLLGFSIVFLGDSPPHRCLIPEAANMTEEWRLASIPTEVVNGEAQYSSCTRYRLDLISNLSALGLSPSKDVNLSHVPLEGCSDGWTYSKEVYQSTVVTEFDLVCDSEWKQPFTTFLFFFGTIFGCFISGQLSDRLGRKPVLFLTMAMQVLPAIIQACSPSWEVFSALYFIMGLGQYANHEVSFVLGIEILTGRPRMIFSSLGIFGFYTLGYTILPLFAYFIRDWRTLLVAICIPSLIYIPLWWLLSESPRWLRSKGRVEEAEAILRGAAMRNGVTAPEVIFTQTEADKKLCTKEAFQNYLQLLKIRELRHITLALCLIRFSISANYHSLSLNTPQLHGNHYLNSFFSAAAEIPAYAASWLALQYSPRRLSCTAVMLIGGAVIFCVQLVPADLPSLVISLEMIGKFFVSCALALIYGYSGELYPTVMRNSAMGTCSMASQLGASLAPYFVQLGLYKKSLLYTVLGSLTSVSALITLFLPETFGLPLPDTIEQVPKRETMKWPCLSSEQQKNDKTRPGKSLAENHF